MFFHCVMILGFETPDTRVAVHSLAGTFVYGVFAAKVLIVRALLPAGRCPRRGSRWRRRSCSLWLTSSLWYFTNVRFGF